VALTRRVARLQAIMGAVRTTTTLQIEALRAEAAQAGDTKQTAMCDRALAGSWRATRGCARVLRERAQVPS
jgi:hypothetical protein